MPRRSPTTLPELSAMGLALDLDLELPPPSGTDEDDPPSGVNLSPGALEGVPRLAISRDRLMNLSLDHRAGFVLSFVDGVFSVEMILDACGMDQQDVLTILADLARRRIIVLA